MIVKLLFFILAFQNVKSDACKSQLGVYKYAAVGTHALECAPIGSDILKRGGTAVDAAIAVLFCEGVASFHSMGLGGGFMMTIYNGTTGKAEFLNARETAPLNANKDTFAMNYTLSLIGGQAVGVPGALLGYWEAHQKYGKLPWKDLLQPTIDLCETGVTVTKYLANSIKAQTNYIFKEPTLYELLVNSTTNTLYTDEGDKIKMPKLKRTLEMLANSPNPAELFYNGTMGQNLVKEIQDYGGIITAADFSNYKVNWTKPLESKLGSMTIYSAPPPGSGALLTFILHILHGFDKTTNKNVMWQRIIESCKWAYARRTELGDPHFVDIGKVLNELMSETYAKDIKELIKDNSTSNDPKDYGAITMRKDDHGTAHISVLAPDGSAVAATASINLGLGAKFRSKSTGIIFNNQMNDFSNPKNDKDYFGLPSSPINFIQPNKRPQSSMTPVIIVDGNNKVKLIIGGAGGSRIISALAAITYLHLYNNYTIQEAIDEIRVHHQFFPMAVQTEKGFSEETIKYLQSIGHETRLLQGIGSAIVGISKSENEITAASDCRRVGKTAGF